MTPNARRVLWIWQTVRSGAVTQALRAMKCETCGGDGFVPAVTEREHLHPDASGVDGEPLARCPSCGGDD